MGHTKAGILELLQQLGIKCACHEHAPVMTCEALVGCARRCSTGTHLQLLQLQLLSNPIVCRLPPWLEFLVLSPRTCS
jgi:hypothetical protein